MSDSERFTFSDEDFRRLLSETRQKETVQTTEDAIAEALTLYQAIERPEPGRLTLTGEIRDRINRQLPLIAFDMPIHPSFEYENRSPLHRRLYTDDISPFELQTDDLPQAVTLKPRFAEYIDYETTERDLFASRLAPRKLQKITIGAHHDLPTRTEAAGYLLEHPLGFDFQTIYYLLRCGEEGALVKVVALPWDMDDSRVDVMPHDPTAHHVLSPLTHADTRITENILGQLADGLTPEEYPDL